MISYCRFEVFWRLPGTHKFLHLSLLQIWIVVSSQLSVSCGWPPPGHHWCTLSPQLTWCASPASGSRKPMHKFDIEKQDLDLKQHWRSWDFGNRKGLRPACRQILYKFFIRTSLVFRPGKPIWSQIQLLVYSVQERFFDVPLLLTL